jgi:hypothetical protein
MTPAADDNATPATPAPQVPPPTDTRAEPPLTAPAPSATVRKQVPERPAAVAEDGGHVPPLFGTAFALIIIVLGSVVARLGAKLIRARRRGGVARTESIASPPFLHERDTPGLVPHMPREDDITRATPPPWMMRGAPAARRDAATSGDDATRSIPDSARELEHNVRELLHRMRSDLQAVRRTAAAPAMPRARSAEELDQVPAMWRQGRRRPAG